MKSKKHVTIAGMLVAIAVGLIFYVPTIMATQADVSPEEYKILDVASEHPWIRQGCCWRNEFRCGRHWYWVIKNSEPVTVDGTVVGLIRHMLVLDVGDGQVRVLLPPVWSVGMEIVRAKDLFDNGFLVQGENVTVKALKTSLVAEEDYDAYLLFGYEITNATVVHAFAVLPFNIEA